MNQTEIMWWIFPVEVTTKLKMENMKARKEINVEQFIVELENISVYGMWHWRSAKQKFKIKDSWKFEGIISDKW